MTMRRISALTGSLLLMLTLVAGTNCSKKATNPGGGGGTKELNSGNLAPAAQYAHTFMTAGTFDYHCAIHGLGMAGSVTVQAGGAASAAIAIGDNFYNPNTGVIVAPGATVTWTNGGGTTHTVTSN